MLQCWLLLIINAFGLAFMMYSLQVVFAAFSRLYMAFDCFIFEKISFHFTVHLQRLLLYYRLFYSRLLFWVDDGFGFLMAFRVPMRDETFEFGSQLWAGLFLGDHWIEKGRLFFCVFLFLAFVEYKLFVPLIKTFHCNFINYIFPTVKSCCRSTLISKVKI